MRPTRPRIKIRVPKKAATLDLGETWTDHLQPALRHIYDRNPYLLSFETLNNAVYRLVNQQHGRALYRRYGDDLREYLVTSKADGALENTSGDLISYIARLWTDFVFSMKLVGDILRYLNQSYCKEAEVASVEQLGEVIFRDKILRLEIPNQVDKKLENVLFDQAIAAINAERRGGLPDSGALKKVIEMLLSIPFEESGLSDCMYVEQLEPMIIQSTVGFYAPEVDKLIETSTPPEQILEEIDGWLCREKSRGERYLPRSTRESIQSVLETRIVADAVPRIVTSPIVATWMEASEMELIKLAANLEKTTNNATSIIVDRIKEWAQSTQSAINQSALSSYTGKGAIPIVKEWVDKTLVLYNSIHNVGEEIYQVFEGRVNATTTVISGWADEFNKFDTTAVQSKQNITSSEFLAQYLDDILKKSPKTRSEPDMESALSNTAVLYEALMDKDRFNKDYRLLLARRLLNNRIQSDELESVFVDRMRRISGPSSTANIENMFKDMQISKEFNQKFRKAFSGVPTQVNVVRNNFWPSSVTKEKVVSLPPTLDEAKHAFEDYYLSQTSGRKLRWNMSFCTAELTLRVPAGIYSLTVNVGPLAVLMLFQGGERLTIQEVSERTHIEFAELERIIPPLVFAPKSQLLRKTPNDRKILPSDTLFFNTEFTSQTPRIRIMNVSGTSKAESDRQRKEVSAEVQGDRSMAVQAAIVRVMKARKEMSHALLVEQVSLILSKQFRASPGSIKREIGELIDTEYLRRSEADPSVYIYIS
ncbi:Cullin-3 [Wickerhamiella sorbophila]|uniref:Cullin-3 n=1 Tax=Wickerhamiella sorbophila TaxID=45607 RepID=A0A2T0FFB0_9ASCO|nr:Cullin-3 [Wickerhamiella sorbophila]PRT53681.1 Cullin-3 [Wickerhamiella sorbophila]